jgi:ATP-dependent Clp protease, protease subunit
MSEQKNNNNNNNNCNKTSKKRDFILDGTINESTSRTIAEKILDINNYDREKELKNDNYVAEPIKIYINSYGGVIYDANFIVGAIENSATPVHTYCHGKAMSAGFLIFISGHHRIASSFATFMYHDASVGMNDTIEALKISLEHYQDLRDLMDEYIIERTNLPRRLMDEHKRVKENLYLFAQEAKVYGIVDEIIPLRRYK